METWNVEGMMGGAGRHGMLKGRLRERGGRMEGGVEDLPIFFGSKYTSFLYRPGGALYNSINANACRQQHNTDSSILLDMYSRLRI